MGKSGYLRRMVQWILFGGVAIVGNNVFFNEANGQVSSWPEGKIYSLKGIQCSVSAPVLVARSKGYLWFSTLVRLDKDNLFAVMQNRGDEVIDPFKTTALISRSRDGGLHWGEPRNGFYGECPLPLADASHLLMPFYLARGPGGLTGYFQRFVREVDDVEWIKEGVIVTGWPRPDGDNWQKHRMAGFVFNGQTVDLKEGGHLATLYGYFMNTKRYALVTADSTDGRKWKIRSIVADENCKLKGKEGPCEAATCRLKDGRLMCVFRLASNVPYGQCWSSDEGRTWTEPVAMVGPHSVQPSLAVIKDGVIVLSGGRPGIYLWINMDGTGKDWQQIDVMAHHNTCQPKEKISASSSYTEVVALDETTLLMIYDRLPFPWKPIPVDSAESNSVWVVRLSLSYTESVIR